MVTDTLAHQQPSSPYNVCNFHSVLVFMKGSFHMPQAKSPYLSLAYSLLLYFIFSYLLSLFSSSCYCFSFLEYIFLAKASHQKFNCFITSQSLHAHFLSFLQNFSIHQEGFRVNGSTCQNRDRQHWLHQGLLSSWFSTL